MNEQQFLETLPEIAQSLGPAQAAKELAERMRREHRYTELFEALKMQHRLELGLPAVHVEPLNEEALPALSAELQDALDKRLLDACREVGAGLLARGQLQEGWMYMRAVGDNAAAAAALAQVEATQDNLDMLLNLYIHEGVDVARGTQLSLQMRGTCNTITMMDAVVAMRGRKDQQAAVGQLVEHVYRELLDSLKADVARRDPKAFANQPATKISEILTAFPNLLRDGSYHLDTTHLSSTVRFARILDDTHQLRLASELAEYGRQLHSQYQYASEEPFADLYPMSLAWFRALLGESVDGALRLFLQKAESLDVEEHGTVAIETYADLLTRVGRPAQATAFLIKAMPRGMRPFGIAPSLMELAQAAGDFSPMIAHAKSRGDLIGFAAATLQSLSLMIHQNLDASGQPPK